MTAIGYHLACEEHAPEALVRNARRAAEIGFEFLTISDHFHPWIDAQGESPFVWSVLGAVAEATDEIAVGTAVTCPTVRTHPAIIAHAAATTAAMMPGRFFLGVGTGENLNEHIFGDPWPPTAVRREMLEEAVHVMRLLWQGGMRSHHGRHYALENARLYTLPEEPPPVVVSAFGPHAAELAGKIGDGFMNTSPEPGLVEVFERAGGAGKACYGKLDVCWADDERDARRVAHQSWPTSPLPGELGLELPVPAHFEQAIEMVEESDVAESILCGADPERYVAAIREFVAAGYDRVTIQQCGPDQDGFFRFFERELAPVLNRG